MYAKLVMCFRAIATQFWTHFEHPLEVDIKTITTLEDNHNHNRRDSVNTLKESKP
jgi:hypothetical protein